MFYLQIIFTNEHVITLLQKLDLLALLVIHPPSANSTTFQNPPPSQPSTPSEHRNFENKIELVAETN